MLLFEVLGDEDEGGFPEAQMVSTIVAVVKAKSMVVRAKMSVLKTRALVLLSLDGNNVVSVSLRRTLSSRSMPPYCLERAKLQGDMKQ
jgi:hypothetical protein